MLFFKKNISSYEKTREHFTALDLAGKKKSVLFWWQKNGPTKTLYLFKLLAADQQFIGEQREQSAEILNIIKERLTTMTEKPNVQDLIKCIEEILFSLNTQPASLSKEEKTNKPTANISSENRAVLIEKITSLKEISRREGLSLLEENTSFLNLLPDILWRLNFHDIRQEIIEKHLQNHELLKSIILHFSETIDFLKNDELRLYAGFLKDRFFNVDADPKLQELFAQTIEDYLSCLIDDQPDLWQEISGFIIAKAAKQNFDDILNYIFEKLDDDNYFVLMHTLGKSLMNFEKEQNFNFILRPSITSQPELLTFIQEKTGVYLPLFLGKKICGQNYDLFRKFIKNDYRLLLRQNNLVPAAVEECRSAEIAVRDHFASLLSLKNISEILGAIDRSLQLPADVKIILLETWAAKKTAENVYLEAEKERLVSFYEKLLNEQEKLFLAELRQKFSK